MAEVSTTELRGGKRGTLFSSVEKREKQDAMGADVPSRGGGEKVEKNKASTPSKILSYKAVAARAVLARPGVSTSDEEEKSSGADSCEKAEDTDERKSDRSRSVPKGYNGPSKSLQSARARSGEKSAKVGTCLKSVDGDSSKEEDNMSGALEGAGAAGVDALDRRKSSGGSSSLVARGKRQKQLYKSQILLSMVATVELPIFVAEVEKEEHVAIMLRPGSRRRRCPVDSTTSRLLFWGVRCKHVIGTCPEGDRCRCCHTETELYFHPAVYKATLCSNKGGGGKGGTCCFSSSSSNPSAAQNRSTLCGRTNCCCWKAHSKSDLRVEHARNYALPGPKSQGGGEGSTPLEAAGASLASGSSDTTEKRDTTITTTTTAATAAALFSSRAKTGSTSCTSALLVKAEGSTSGPAAVPVAEEGQEEKPTEDKDECVLSRLSSDWVPRSSPPASLAVAAKEPGGGGAGGPGVLSGLNAASAPGEGGAGGAGAVLNFLLPDGSLDLNVFKVFPCRNKNLLHERKSCPFYHNYRDKRRAPITYRAEQCEEHFDLDTATVQCSKGDNCERCHNRHELLYHPNIYKQRFCSNFPNNGRNICCARGIFCAFAHTRGEIRATLFTEQEEKHPDCNFFVSKFKTVWCPYGSQHDWHTCGYAHTYQDCRRSPAIGYGSEPCPAWNKDLHSADYDKRCPHGARCSFSHGSKEQLYHPSYYKTMPCIDYRPQSGGGGGAVEAAGKPHSSGKGNNGPGQRGGGLASIGGCPRGFLCAFYHDVSERRIPGPPPLPQFSYTQPLPLAQLKFLQPLFLQPPLFNLDDFEAFGHQSRLSGMARRSGPANNNHHHGSMEGGSGGACLTSYSYASSFPSSLKLQQNGGKAFPHSNNNTRALPAPPPGPGSSHGGGGGGGGGVLYSAGPQPSGSLKPQPPPRLPPHGTQLINNTNGATSSSSATPTANAATTTATTSAYGSLPPPPQPNAPPPHPATPSGGGGGGGGRLRRNSFLTNGGHNSNNGNSNSSSGSNGKNNMPYGGSPTHGHDDDDPPQAHNGIATHTNNNSHSAGSHANNSNSHLMTSHDNTNPGGGGGAGGGVQKHSGGRLYGVYTLQQQDSMKSEDGCSNHVYSQSSSLAGSYVSSSSNESLGCCCSPGYDPYSSNNNHANTSQDFGMAELMMGGGGGSSNRPGNESLRHSGRHQRTVDNGDEDGAVGVRAPTSTATRGLACGDPMGEYYDGDLAWGGGGMMGYSDLQTDVRTTRRRTTEEAILRGGMDSNSHSRRQQQQHHHHHHVHRGGGLTGGRMDECSSSSSPMLHRKGLSSAGGDCTGLFSETSQEGNYHHHPRHHHHRGRGMGGGGEEEDRGGFRRVSPQGKNDVFSSSRGGEPQFDPSYWGSRPYANHHQQHQLGLYGCGEEEQDVIEKSGGRSRTHRMASLTIPPPPQERQLAEHHHQQSAEVFLSNRDTSMTGNSGGKSCYSPPADGPLLGFSSSADPSPGDHQFPLLHQVAAMLLRKTSPHASAEELAEEGEGRGTVLPCVLEGPTASGVTTTKEKEHQVLAASGPSAVLSSASSSSSRCLADSGVSVSGGGGGTRGGNASSSSTSSFSSSSSSSASSLLGCEEFFEDDIFLHASRLHRQEVHGGAYDATDPHSSLLFVEPFASSPTAGARASHEGGSKLFPPAQDYRDGERRGAAADSGGGGGGQGEQHEEEGGKERKRQEAQDRLCIEKDAMIPSAFLPLFSASSFDGEREDPGHAYHRGDSRSASSCSRSAPPPSIRGEGASGSASDRGESQLVGGAGGEGQQAGESSVSSSTTPVTTPTQLVVEDSSSSSTRGSSRSSDAASRDQVGGGGGEEEEGERASSADATWARFAPQRKFVGLFEQGGGVWAPSFLPDSKKTPAGAPAMEEGDSIKNERRPRAEGSSLLTQEAEEDDTTVLGVYGRHRQQQHPPPPLSFHSGDSGGLSSQRRSSEIEGDLSLAWKVVSSASSRKDVNQFVEGVSEEKSLTKSSSSSSSSSSLVLSPAESQAPPSASLPSSSAVLPALKTETCLEDFNKGPHREGAGPVLPRASPERGFEDSSQAGGMKLFLSRSSSLSSRQSFFGQGASGRGGLTHHGESSFCLQNAFASASPGSLGHGRAQAQDAAAPLAVQVGEETSRHSPQLAPQLAESLGAEDRTARSLTSCFSGVLWGGGGGEGAAGGGQGGGISGESIGQERDEGRKDASSSNSGGGGSSSKSSGGVGNTNTSGLFSFSQSGEIDYAYFASSAPPGLGGFKKTTSAYSLSSSPPPLPFPPLLNAIGSPHLDQAPPSSLPLSLPRPPASTTATMEALTKHLYDDREQQARLGGTECSPASEGFPVTPTKKLPPDQREWVGACAFAPEPSEEGHDASCAAFSSLEKLQEQETAVTAAVAAAVALFDEDDAEHEETDDPLRNLSLNSTCSSRAQKVDLARTLECLTSSWKGLENPHTPRGLLNRRGGRRRNTSFSSFSSSSSSSGWGISPRQLSSGLFLSNPCHQKPAPGETANTRFVTPAQQQPQREEEADFSAWMLRLKSPMVSEEGEGERGNWRTPAPASPQLISTKTIRPPLPFLQSPWNPRGLGDHELPRHHHHHHYHHPAPCGAGGKREGGAAARGRVDCGVIEMRATRRRKALIFSILSASVESQRFLLDRLLEVGLWRRVVVVLGRRGKAEEEEEEAEKEEVSWRGVEEGRTSYYGYEVMMCNGVEECGEQEESLMRAFWKEHDEEKNRLLILKEKETKESATPPVLKCLYTSFHQYARQKSAGDCRRPPEAIAVFCLHASPAAFLESQATFPSPVVTSFVCPNFEKRTTGDFGTTTSPLPLVGNKSAGARLFASFPAPPPPSSSFLPLKDEQERNASRPEVSPSRLAADFPPLLLPGLTAIGSDSSRNSEEKEEEGAGGVGDGQGVCPSLRPSSSSFFSPFFTLHFVVASSPSSFVRTHRTSTTTAPGKGGLYPETTRDSQVVFLSSRHLPLWSAIFESFPVLPLQKNAEALLSLSLSPESNYENPEATTSTTKSATTTHTKAMYLSMPRVGSDKPGFLTPPSNTNTSTNSTNSLEALTVAGTGPGGRGSPASSLSSLPPAAVVLSEDDSYDSPSLSSPRPAPSSSSSLLSKPSPTQSPLLPQGRIGGGGRGGGGGQGVEDLARGGCVSTASKWRRRSASTAVDDERGISLDTACTEHPTTSLQQLAHPPLGASTAASLLLGCEEEEEGENDRSPSTVDFTTPRSSPPPSPPLSSKHLNHKEEALALLPPPSSSSSCSTQLAKPEETRGAPEGSPQQFNFFGTPSKIERPNPALPSLHGTTLPSPPHAEQMLLVAEERRGQQGGQSANREPSSEEVIDGRQERQGEGDDPRVFKSDLVLTALLQDELKSFLDVSCCGSGVAARLSKDWEIQSGDVAETTSFARHPHDLRKVEDEPSRRETLFFVCWEPPSLPSARGKGGRWRRGGGEREEERERKASRVRHSHHDEKARRSDEDDGRETQTLCTSGGDLSSSSSCPPSQHCAAPQQPQAGGEGAAQMSHRLSYLMAVLQNKTREDSLEKTSSPPKQAKAPSGYPPDGKEAAPPPHAPAPVLGRKTEAVQGDDNESRYRGRPVMSAVVGKGGRGREEEDESLFAARQEERKRLGEGGGGLILRMDLKDLVLGCLHERNPNGVLDIKTELLARQVFPSSSVSLSSRPGRSAVRERILLMSVPVKAVFLRRETDHPTETAGAHGKGQQGEATAQKEEKTRLSGWKQDRGGEQEAEVVSVPYQTLWCSWCGQKARAGARGGGRGRGGDADENDGDMCCFVRCTYTTHSCGGEEEEEKTAQESSRVLDCPHFYHQSCIDVMIRTPEACGDDESLIRCPCTSFIPRLPRPAVPPSSIDEDDAGLSARDGPLARQGTLGAAEEPSGTKKRTASEGSSPQLEEEKKMAEQERDSNLSLISLSFLRLAGDALGQIPSGEDGADHEVEEAFNSGAGRGAGGQGLVFPSLDLSSSSSAFAAPSDPAAFRMYSPVVCPPPGLARAEAPSVDSHRPSATGDGQKDSLLLHEILKELGEAKANTREREGQEEKRDGVLLKKHDRSWENTSKQEDVKKLPRRLPDLLKAILTALLDFQNLTATIYLQGRRRRRLSSASSYASSNCPQPSGCCQKASCSCPLVVSPADLFLSSFPMTTSTVASRDTPLLTHEGGGSLPSARSSSVTVAPQNISLLASPSVFFPPPPPSSLPSAFFLSPLWGPPSRVRVVLSLFGSSSPLDKLLRADPTSRAMPSFARTALCLILFILLRGGEGGGGSHEVMRALTPGDKDTEEDAFLPFVPCPRSKMWRLLRGELSRRYPALLVHLVCLLLGDFCPCVLSDVFPSQHHREEMERRRRNGDEGTMERKSEKDQELRKKSSGRATLPPLFRSSIATRSFSSSIYHPFFWAPQQKIDFLEKYLQFIRLTEVGRHLVKMTDPDVLKISPFSASLPSTAQYEGQATTTKGGSSLSAEKEGASTKEVLEDVSRWTTSINGDLFEAMETLTLLVEGEGHQQATERHLLSRTTPSGYLSDNRDNSSTSTPGSCHSARHRISSLSAPDLKGLLEFLQCLRTHASSLALKVLPVSAVRTLVEEHLDLLNAEDRDETYLRYFLYEHFDEVLIGELDKVNPRLFLLLFLRALSSSVQTPEAAAIFRLPKELTELLAAAMEESLGFH